jgi:hypothetical protein
MDKDSEESKMRRRMQNQRVCFVFATPTCQIAIDTAVAASVVLNTLFFLSYFLLFTHHYHRTAII